MKIRSITVFAAPGYPTNRLLLDRLGIFARHAKSVFEQSGAKVETARLATPPFPTWLPLDDLVRPAQELSIEASASGFSYLSLGPALPEQPQSYELIPEVIAATQNTFMTGLITRGSGLDLNAAKACAKVIEHLSTVEANGFGNLFFSALANVRPFAPFFPTGFAEEGQPGFALAIEAADLALDVFTQAKSLESARTDLINLIEAKAHALEEIGRKMEALYQYKFRGIDFTLAPHPDENASISRALEAIGLPAFGLAGSIAASAFLTDTLDRAKFLKTGFNGLMLPVLEDSGLAKRSGDGTLSLQNLLLCSAVCGTGLDVIPLPGNTTAKEVYPILLDMGALALRLDKQLTARLMPIPGKVAGEKTGFDFEFFANGTIIPPQSGGVGGFLQEPGILEIKKKY